MSVQVASRPPSPPARLAGYRPRSPRESPLYRVFADHYPAFVAEYEERHQRTWGHPRRIVERTVRGFLRCGLLEHGFARLRCDACRGELLLAFSCKTRGLCASCGARRTAAWARWVAGDLVRGVPHRQVVLTLPKLLRPYFKFRRALLTDLARWLHECIAELMAPLAPEPVRPGAVACLELAGNLLNLQPHVHSIATDGAFSLDGERFYPMPPRLWRLLEERVRRRVIAELHARGLLPAARVRLLLSWRRSGFSVHAGRPVPPEDGEGLERLARYVRRLHLAESRVRYDEGTDRVVYSSGKKSHPGFGGNFRVLDARDFVAAVCGFIPDRYRHETVTYGEYSNVVRGKRRKAGLAPGLALQPAPAGRARAVWRELLRAIYATDPLACACGGVLCPIAVLTDPEVIERILRHLGRWPPPRRTPRPPRPPPSRAAPAPPPSEAEASQVPLWWDDPAAFSQVPPEG